MGERENGRMGNGGTSDCVLPFSLSPFSPFPHSPFSPFLHFSLSPFLPFTLAPFLNLRLILLATKRGRAL